MFQGAGWDRYRTWEAKCVGLSHTMRMEKCFGLSDRIRKDIIVGLSGKKREEESRALSDKKRKDINLGLLDWGRAQMVMGDGSTLAGKGEAHFDRFLAVLNESSARRSHLEQNAKSNKSKYLAQSSAIFSIFPSP